MVMVTESASPGETYRAIGQLQLDGRSRHGRLGCRGCARVRTPLRARRPVRRADQRRHVEGQAPRNRFQDGRGFAHDLAERSGADRGQLVADVLGQGDDEPLDLPRGACELGAQVLPLGGDAGRTGVEVALAGHVAAERDEDGRPQRELLCAQQGCDDESRPVRRPPSVRSATRSRRSRASGPGGPRPDRAPRGRPHA